VSENRRLGAIRLSSLASAGIALALAAGMWAPAQAATSGAAGTGNNLAPMPTARNFLAAATGLDGRIYAVGGADSDSKTAGTLEAYDPATNSWSTKRSMPTARYFLAAATGPDGKIYAVGGSSDPISILATVEAYDPATDSWSAQAPMPSTRAALAAVAAPDGKIYAIGGSNDPVNIAGAVEAFNPATNSWSAEAAMPTPRWGLAATEAPNGKIYVMGGSNDSRGQGNSSVRWNRSIRQPIRGAYSLRWQSVSSSRTAASRLGKSSWSPSRQSRTCASLSS
jgi:N-acetylneuraminic acid mutarotase